MPPRKLCPGCGYRAISPTSGWPLCWACYVDLLNDQPLGTKQRTDHAKAAAYQRARRARHKATATPFACKRPDMPTYQTHWTRPRWFIGHANGKHTVFRSTFIPTEESHGQLYKYCTGPFATKRKAELQARCYT